MHKIQQMLTKVNYTPLANKRNMWIVIHYVGAVSTAKNNALYFLNNNRQASANYFVDENEIWQVVEDTNGAWHIGGAYKYFNSARNNNSIGIEMCCKKDQNGRWYIEPETIQNTIELTRYLMDKWNIPIERVTTHYLTTGKICPEPFVRNPELWQDFLRRVKEAKTVEEKELTVQEKCEVIKQYYGFDDNTCLYFQLYRYNTALIDKLYAKAKNG